MNPSVPPALPPRRIVAASDGAAPRAAAGSAAVPSGSGDGGLVAGVVGRLGELGPGVRVVDRELYRRDPRVVAPELLGKLLVRAGGDGDGAGPGPLRAGRIVEAEAYCGSEDPGSHAYRGETDRNRTMFGPPGGLYVYFTYGMHWCANVVCGEEGVGVAVLLRALAPVAGVEAMWAARPRARRERDLCSGPAKLCQALGLDRGFDGADLVTGDRGVVVADDGTRPPPDPVQTTRIGLAAGAEHPWRWYVPGDPNVSTPRTR